MGITPSGRERTGSIEYQVVKLSSKRRQAEITLNVLGQDGWYLVAVDSRRWAILMKQSS